MLKLARIKYILHLALHLFPHILSQTNKTDEQKEQYEKTNCTIYLPANIKNFARAVGAESWPTHAKTKSSTLANKLLIARV